uniref:Uncharacterized protein n=1 Tax=Rhizophora mucronata TaxID=61149 RepID=A0A2P2PPE4_RHIMU
MEIARERYLQITDKPRFQLVIVWQCWSLPRA